jgi:hypothetical protein
MQVIWYYSEKEKGNINSAEVASLFYPSWGDMEVISRDPFLSYKECHEEIYMNNPCNIAVSLLHGKPTCWQSNLYISCLYFLIPRLCSRQTIDDAPWLGWKIPGDILNGGCYRTRWEEVGWENDEYEIIINSSLFIKKKILITRLEFTLWITMILFFFYFDILHFHHWFFLFGSFTLWWYGLGLGGLFCLYINEDVEEIFYCLVWQNKI